MKSIIKLPPLIILLGSLIAFNSPAQSLAKMRTWTVRTVSHSPEQSFSSHIKPLNSSWVQSPYDGEIITAFKTLGDRVQRGDTLILLKKTNEKKELNEAVKNFLIAKQAFDKDKSHFRGDIELHKAGIDSEEQFQENMSRHTVTVANYYAAKYHLDQTLEKWHLFEKKIRTLNLKSYPHFLRDLQNESELVKIKSPRTGVLLLPQNKKNQELTPGNTIKEGHVVAMIGETAHFLLELQASEIEVSSIKKGLKATITGIGFPGCQLGGQVLSVSASTPPNTQANSVSYLVRVKANNNVNSAACSAIRFGMSAKVSLRWPQEKTLSVPLVFLHRNKSGVDYVIRARDQKHIPVSVKRTTPNGMAFLTGNLRNGCVLTMGSGDENS